MRYSTIAVSLLVSTASAWRLPAEWSGRGNQGWSRPSHSSSVAVSAAPTNPAPTKTAASVSVATSVATVVPTSAVPDAAPTDVGTKTSTAATSTGTSSSGSLTSDEQSALDAHNAARSDVGTAPLTWDASLAADALAYAQTLASSGSFEHSGTSGQGENLYMQSSSGDTLTNAVSSFISEKSSYNGEAITSTNYQGFGHYSKLLRTII
jgi:uncharacterized protein YkwD